MLVISASHIIEGHLDLNILDCPMGKNDIRTVLSGGKDEEIFRVFRVLRGFDFCC